MVNLRFDDTAISDPDNQLMVDLDLAKEEQRTALGEAIRRAIEEAPMTQEAIAEEVGVSKQAVTNWKKGKISKENLGALEDTLNYRRGYFMSLVGKSSQPDTKDPRLEKISAIFQKLNNKGKDHLLDQAESIDRLLSKSKKRS